MSREADEEDSANLPFVTTSRCACSNPSGQGGLTHRRCVSFRTKAGTNTFDGDPKKQVIFEEGSIASTPAWSLSDRRIPRTIDVPPVDGPDLGCAEILAKEMEFSR